MHHALKNNVITIAAALVPSLLRLPSSAVESALARPSASAQDAGLAAKPRSGLRHGANLIRYIFFGKGAYAPPIGKFNV